MRRESSRQKYNSDAFRNRRHVDEERIMNKHKSVKSGCWVSDGQRSIELEIGWYKNWVDENSYCWQFIGPVSMWPPGGPYRNLVVLGHMPNMDEVRKIEARFADAKAPDGTAGKICPLSKAA